MILSGSDTSNHFPFGWYTPKSAVLTLKKSVRGPNVDCRGTNILDLTPGTV